MTDHPITPPPELLARWEEDWHHAKVKHVQLEDHIATQAARWGADQELEACCAIATCDPVCGTQHQRTMLAQNMKAKRRPKPPSLKERALQAWAAVEAGTDDQTAMAVIRRALEQLDD